MCETWVQSLGWEDPLEKGKATHSGILTWRTPWPWDRKESDTTEQLSLTHSLTHLYIKPAPTILGSIPNPTDKATPRTDQVCTPREGEKQQTSKQINERFRAMK